MVIGCCEITLRAEWVKSLKEKRMTLTSIIEKTRHKFNVAIAETDTQDEHKTLTIGFACVSNQADHADEMIEKILRYIENSTDAYVIDVYKEIL